MGASNIYAYAGGNPLSNIDPDGRFFFVPLFGPTAATISADAITIGAAWWSTQMAAKPPRVTDPAANNEWQQYKDQYAEPPPPNLDECEMLRWKLKREQALLAARQAWDAKWGSHHADAIAQSQRAIKNFEDKLKKAGCSCP